MRARYGASLRQFLSRQNPLRLLDLGPGVFTATVDTNILLVQKADNQNALYALTLAEKSQLGRLAPSAWQPLPAPSKAAWMILTPTQRALKEKIERLGTPLKDWDVEIYRGILTGCNDAFIINTARRDALIKADPKSADILKPILRGRDIKRYRHEWAGLWVIATFPALRLNIDDYPAVKRYLQSFGKRLEQSGAKGSRKKTRNQWFETQDQISYHQAFEKERVVWTDIATKPTFKVLEKGIYFNNTVYMLYGASPKYLNGVLNSRVIEYYFPLIATDLGDKGSRYFKQFVEQIPIPAITPANQSQVSEIETLVDAILGMKDIKPIRFAKPYRFEEEKAIDRLVYKLYGLTEGEVEIVEKG